MGLFVQLCYTQESNFQGFHLQLNAKKAGLSKLFKILINCKRSVSMFRKSLKNKVSTLFIKFGGNLSGNKEDQGRQSQKNLEVCDRILNRYDRER